MNTDIEKIISDMTLAQDKYNLALETQIGLAQAKEYVKNVGFNYFGELLEIVKKYKDADEQVALLQVALDDSDRELSALKSANKNKKNKAQADTE